MFYLRNATVAFYSQETNNGIFVFPLSQPDRTGMLVAISLLKLYSNEVISLGPGPLRRGDALRRHGNKAEYKL
jgi:hypothetical protein